MLLASKAILVPVALQMPSKGIVWLEVSVYVIWMLSDINDHMLGFDHKICLFHSTQAFCLIIDIKNMLYIPHCVEQTVAGL